MSPPYANPQTGGGIAKKGYDGPKHSKTDLVGKRTYMPENIVFRQGNISSLKYRIGRIKMTLEEIMESIESLTFDELCELEDFSGSLIEGKRISGEAN